MEETFCTICQKTNRMPDGALLVIAQFAQKYQAENAILAIEAAHIIPAWVKIFTNTLVIELHGIRDVVRLQALFIESMCQERSALTCTTFTTQSAKERALRDLQSNVL